MLRKIVLAFFTLTIFSSSLFAEETEKWNAYIAFQKDADIVRLKHLKYYGELIEEYKAKVGGYPFMEQANVPLYVHIASPKQEQYAKMKPPYKHKT